MHEMLSQLGVLVVFEDVDGRSSWTSIDESPDVVTSEWTTMYLMEFSAFASRALSREEGILIFSR